MTLCKRGGLPFLVLMIALSACSTYGRAPRFGAVELDPPTLKPLDTAILTVKLNDKFGIVSRVEGVIREDPEIVFRFQDDGQEPDKKAGDGVWTLKIEVPFEAPAGDFNLDIRGYNRHGETVQIPDETGAAVPLQVSKVVTISYPKEP